jgi:hypothetical protein
MTRVAAFGRFWFDFVVGDDWRLAAGVVALLTLVHAAGLWWVLPLGIAALLAFSVSRAAAVAKRGADQP